jgi:hypothetical protein
VGAYNSTMIAQVQAASFIFTAKVTAVDATNVPDTTATPNTVVATVGTIAFAGAELQDLIVPVGTGSAITIDLLQANLAVGDQVVLLGQTENYNGGVLEVSEIARVDPTAYPTFLADVPRLEQLFASDPLYAEIASSSQIIEGTVASVAPSAEVCGSEHCPAWQLAQVEVDAALCGSTATPATVSTGFSGSTDIAWYQAPKLVAAQDGVFLLHHAVAPFAFSDDAPDLYVVKQLDVQPDANMAMIEAILASPPPLP